MFITLPNITVNKEQKKRIMDDIKAGKETLSSENYVFINCSITVQFYMLVENGVEGKVIPAMGCPQRAICPSCSSDTGT